MDMSFATQALTVQWCVKHKGELTAKVYPVPPEVEQYVARLKLETMGIHIDQLTPEQAQYLNSWQLGT